MKIKFGLSVSQEERSVLTRILVIFLAVLWGVAILTPGVVAAKNVVEENAALLSTFAIAEYAHLRAGDPIPLDVEYTEQKPINVWGMQTNSPWLTTWVKKIVPAFGYEKVCAVPKYPRSIGFTPNPGYRSFHIAGFARPFLADAWLNERFLIDGRWNDARDALATLTHELIHLQGGGYIVGEPEEFENRTQAATVETLAAMCNYGEETACRAFWQEYEGYTRIVFRLMLEDAGHGDWYNRIANLLWRDSMDERAAEKASRFWAEDPDQLDYIYRAYYLGPWKIIQDGVLLDVPQDTGIMNWTTLGEIYKLQMPFDDTGVLLRPVRLLLWWSR